jgi:sugar-specific transcriptional regulator TrmB
MREVLLNLGMNEEEVTIYLLLLGKGKLKATQISSSLGFHRTNVYRILDRMQIKGYVNELLEEGVKTYKPTKPNNLLNLIKDKIYEVENIIPSLTKIYNQNEHDFQIELLKGNQGFKLIQNEILDSKTDYTVYGPVTKYLPQELKLFVKGWTIRAENIKLKGKILCSEKDIIYISKFEDVKKLPDELISDITFITYSNKTTIIIWSNIINVIKVDNKNFTDSMRRNFDYLWNKLI